MIIFMAVIFAVFGIVLSVWGADFKNYLVLLIGIFFVGAALFLGSRYLADRKLRKLYEQDPEEYERRYGGDEEELTEEEIELEQIKDFDSDSGKGYCPHCGNYGVNSEKICESCGEKVID